MWLVLYMSLIVCSFFKGTIESSGANVVGVPSPETVGIPVLSGSPPKAWMSPSDEADGWLCVCVCLCVHLDI